MNQTHADERFWDALAAWEAAYLEGRDLAAEELCADCPDLLDKLKDHIRALKRTAWMTKRTEDAADAEAQNELPFHPFNLGEYTLFERIGSGGMGQVFLALHRRMERIVVVKLLPKQAISSPEAARQFHDEAKVAAKLTHPNIVTAYDAGESDGIPFLVMERVGGVDLHHHVQQHGPLPIEQAVSVVVQAAHGLQYAHLQGIIHCDVKPANLLLGKDGTVKLLDLGLARFHLSDTSQASAMGTPHFMAPEQTIAPIQVDHRADIYALGCSLFFLLTGQPPFAGKTVIQSVVAHRDEPAPSLTAARPDAPAALDAFFQRMVAKQPQDRYPSMAEVIAAVEACGTRTPVDRSAAESTRLRRGPRANKRRLLVLLPMLALLAVVIGVAAFIAVRQSQDHQSRQVTEEGQSKGSPAVVSPEQTRHQTKAQPKTEPTEKPRTEPKWISLADSLDDFKQHWKTDDKRGTIYFDQEKKQIEISSVWNIGSLRCDKSWNELEFEVMMKSAGGFELEINGITLNFTLAFGKTPKNQRVQVKYDPETSVVSGLVDGDVVSKATVLKPKWEDSFHCLIRKPGGAPCELSISKIRLLAK